MSLMLDTNVLLDILTARPEVVALVHRPHP